MHVYGLESSFRWFDGSGELLETSRIPGCQANPFSDPLQDTLASAIYTSSESRKTDVGIVLQRCFLCLGVLYIPCVLLFWFMSPVLLFLGQSEELAANVQAFLRVLAFGAPGYICFESVKKFLQVQGTLSSFSVANFGLSPTFPQESCTLQRWFCWSRAR